MCIGHMAGPMSRDSDVHIMSLEYRQGRQQKIAKKGIRIQAIFQNRNK